MRKTESQYEIAQKTFKLVSFEDMAPTLCLPSRYSNLAAENCKLSDALLAEIKNKTKTPTSSSASSFLSKFNENCVRSESPFETLLNFDRMALMYRRATAILNEYYTAIKFEQISNKSDTKSS